MGHTQASIFLYLILHLLSLKKGQEHNYSCEGNHVVAIIKEPQNYDLLMRGLAETRETKLPGYSDCNRECEIRFCLHLVQISQVRTTQH